MEKYKGKYRISSARAAWWDYSQNGLYFITICTYNRECILGKISKQEMELSPMGEAARDEWRQSFEIRSELYCVAFVAMPKHLHAIVGIQRGHDSGNVETHGRASLPRGGGICYRPPQSISSFVAGFKSSATKRINQLRNTPGAPVWQPRFHDHVIRNQREYSKIAEYIAMNPALWDQDRYFPNENSQ